MRSDASTPESFLFAGVHLSGSNANKTSLVVLAGGGRQKAFRSPSNGPLSSPLKIGKVYEKIGSFGSLFSDERLAQILSLGGPFASVFIDCPLTVPPCVACLRPVCPGAIKCDDVSVAYMLKVSDRLRRRGARKARPINPQSQRLWDVLQLDKERLERLEPSYSANLAPLVARARALQKRLSGLNPKITLCETAVPNALEILREPLDLPDDIRLAYRSFEHGLEARQAVVEALFEQGWFEQGQDQERDQDHEVLVEQLSASVETFHALIAACVAALHGEGLTRPKPEAFVEGEGWVLLPELP